MTGGKIDFRPESGCRIWVCAACFFHLGSQPFIWAFGQKMLKSPNNLKQVQITAISKNCRRLRRALFFQNLSAPAAGFVCSIVSAPAAGSCFSFVKLSHLMLLPSLSRLGPPAKKKQHFSAPAVGFVFSLFFGACGGLCLFNCFGARGGLLFLFR